MNSIEKSMLLNKHLALCKANKEKQTLLSE